MQVTARAPHRLCLVSFVPGVSSAFFPVTTRQPWCGLVRLVSVSCRTEIAQMETSVSFSLRPPVTRLCSHLLSSLLALFLIRSLSRFSLYLLSSSTPLFNVCNALAHLRFRYLIQAVDIAVVIIHSLIRLRIKPFLCVFKLKIRFEFMLRYG